LRTPAHTDFPHSTVPEVSSLLLSMTLVLKYYLNKIQHDFERLKRHRLTLFCIWQNVDHRQAHLNTALKWFITLQLFRQFNYHPST